MAKPLERVRVGFIGAGRISDLHALEYAANPHAEIVAVCDPDTDLAARRAAAWGFPNARIHADHRALLDQADIDAVDILVPHHLHHPIALDAIAANKHVSLQKPMTHTIREADELITAAKRQGTVFRVFENFIFYPPVMKARALVDAGAIGTPVTIRIKSNFGRGKGAWTVPKSAQAWRLDPTKNGGGPCVFDDGHHKFALGWHFMGPAEQVHAWIGSTTAADGYVYDAPAIVSWKFANGAMGSLEVAYSPELEVMTRHYPQDDRVEITGTRGVICINRGHGRIADQPPVLLYRDGGVEGFSDMDTGWEASFIESTRHFIAALRAGEPPRLSGEEGREVLRFTLAATKSAALGRAVRVDEVT